jgi:glycosyltransferase involved in cell wall biosynthesis
MTWPPPPWNSSEAPSALPNMSGTERKISIVVPCRNEAATIVACLESLAASDYPKDRLECLVVDGGSTDGTPGLIEGLARLHPWIRLLRNPDRITPVSLNIGIRRAVGEVILRIDAHATYPADYISRCVRGLDEHRADNVGGIIRTVPGGGTPMARAIARALSHPFGIGNSWFRIGVEEPREADTVPFGCFRRSVFERVGLFDERLSRSQDMEFNLRLRRASGRIVLVPHIVSNYISRPTLAAFFRHNFQNGIWAIYPLKFVRAPFSPRHYAPLAAALLLIAAALALPVQPAAGALALAALAVPYATLSLFFALRTARGERETHYLFTLPVAFAALHLGYGLGSVAGLFKLAMPARERPRKGAG